MSDNREILPKALEIHGHRCWASVAGGEIALAKVTNIAQIMGYGVMSTPGVVIDCKLVHAGGVPGPDQVRSWLHP